MREQFTVETLAKFLQYLVGVIGNAIYLYKCYLSRETDGSSFYQLDDKLVLFFIFCGVCWFVFSKRKENGNSVVKTLINPVVGGYLNGFVVGAAHLFWMSHILRNGVEGITPKYLIFTALVIVCRLIQNKVDMWAADKDPEKSALYIAEMCNLVSWLCACGGYVLKS